MVVAAALGRAVLLVGVGGTSGGSGEANQLVHVQMQLKCGPLGVLNVSRF